MQKILFTFILLVFSIQLIGQEPIDSIVVVFNSTVAFNKIITVPFSKESLDKLPTVKKIIQKKEKKNFKSYFFLFFLNLITIAVLLFQISKNKVKKLFSTLFSINALIQFSKVEVKRNNKYLIAYFFLFFIFFLVFVLLLFLNLNKEIDIINLTIIIASFLLIDYFLLTITAYLFNLKTESAIVSFNNMSFIVVVLPFVLVSILLILFLEANSSLILGTVVFAILLVLYVWKEIRNLLILKANKINIFSFYFFLYLCTFKILPLVVFFKIIYGEVLKS